MGLTAAGGNVSGFTFTWGGNSPTGTMIQLLQQACIHAGPCHPLPMLLLQPVSSSALPLSRAGAPANAGCVID